MKVAIDMQGAQTEFSKNRGVGRYTIEIVKAILDIKENDIDIFLCLNGAFQDSCFEILKEFDGIIPRKNIKIWMQYLSFVTLDNDPVSQQKKKAAELIREWFISQIDPDIIWSTNLQEGATDVAVTSVGIFGDLQKKPIYCSTLHDVTPLIHPAFAGIDKNRSRAEWYESKLEYIKKSDIVFTVSQFSKNKILELLKIKENRVFLVYNGIDFTKFKPSNEFNCLESKEKFILYVGPLDEHKNITLLIDAYSKLPKEVKNEYKLVLAGFSVDALKFKNILKKYPIDKKNIEAIGYISDPQLVALLQSCRLFVFPSLYEGFGLPVAEAMACGALVITSNETAMPELVASDDVLFNPRNSDELKNKIEYFLNDKKDFNSVITLSLDKIKKFDWKESAKVVLSIFKSFNIENRSHSEIDKNILFGKISELTLLSNQDKMILAQTISQNYLNRSNQVTLFVDVSALVLVDDATGIQRVVRALSSELISITSHKENVKLELIYSNPSEHNFYRAIIEKNKIIRDEKKQIIIFNENDKILFADLHPSNIISKRELIKEFKLRNVYVYFILYDLIPLQFPEFFNEMFVDEYSRMLEIFGFSSGVFSISRTVESKYIDFISTHTPVTLPFKTGYFRMGCDLANSLPSGINDSNLLPKEFPPDSYFLVVSRIEPRKRHLQILKAFELLNNHTSIYRLVFVGKKGWEKESTINYIEQKSTEYGWFKWYNRCSDGELITLYQNCKAVINASLEEGFGLPIVEAAFYKRPVILRDIDIFHEVADKNAYYFSGDEPESLAKSILDWEQLPKDDERLSSANIKITNWRDSANDILNLIGLNNE